VRLVTIDIASGEGRLPSQNALSHVIAAAVLIGLIGLARGCGMPGDLAATGSPGAPARVVVRFDATKIKLERQVQLRAIVADAGGRVLHDVPVTWESTNSAVAAVDAKGRVRGVAVGIASISATGAGKSGSVVVTVLPAVPRARVGISVPR